MAGSTGGGSGLIAAYAVVRAFVRDRVPGAKTDVRAALDREELREVEYEEMGLPVPPDHTERPRGWLQRLLRR